MHTKLNAMVDTFRCHKSPNSEEQTNQSTPSDHRQTLQCATGREKLISRPEKAPKGASQAGKILQVDAHHIMTLTTTKATALYW
jgi:hypothetical protein